MSKHEAPIDPASIEHRQQFAAVVAVIATIATLAVVRSNAAEHYTGPTLEDYKQMANVVDHPTAAQDIASQDVLQFMRSGH